MNRSFFLRASAALAAACLCFPSAMAQSAWPDKPVTFVVPFAAGSTTDQLARSLGQSLTEQTKQAVVVDNKAGASGQIAAAQVTRAAADGYTVPITTNTTHAANEMQDIAIARSGDKGNRATLSVISRAPDHYADHYAAHYAVLERLLTVERVQADYRGIVQGQVQRYALPHLYAVHFVMDEALAGGVTRSLALDAHGKALSAAILDIEVDEQHPLQNPIHPTTGD